MIELDHLILPVNDRARSVAFYTSILCLKHESDDGPFSILRVTPRFTIAIAPWGTDGGQHLAFAMAENEFDAAFDRLRVKGIAYGGSFSTVGCMQGPGEELGSQGMGKTIYFFDPDKHLIEIRHYGVS